MRVAGARRAPGDSGDPGSATCTPRSCGGAQGSLDFRLTIPSRRAAPPDRRPCPPAGGALPCLEAMLRRGARVVLALLLALVTLLAPIAERSSDLGRVPAAQAQTVRPPSWR